MPASLEETPAPPPPPPTNPDVERALQTVFLNILSPMFNSRHVFHTQKRDAPEPDETDNQNPSKKQGTGSYRAFGRIVSRQIDPFTKIDMIVNFGILHDGKDSEGESGSGDEHLAVKDRRLLEGWKTLCCTIPSFRTSMLALSKERKLRRKVCQEIQDSANGVRTDDRSTLKDGILGCLLLDKNIPLSPPIESKSRDKAGRGFCHPVIAHLLSPIKYPATEETYTALREKRLPVTASLLPRFLYPDNHVFDRNDVEKDVLRGHLLYRAAKIIFQGPSMGHEKPGAHRGQGGNAALCGLTSLTPVIIAYIAVQVRHALSNQSSWSNTDGAFNYTEFFWNIVDLFEDEESGREILEFYNYHVFGTPPGASAADPLQEPIEDDFEILRQQRAAKRARVGT